MMSNTNLSKIITRGGRLRNPWFTLSFEAESIQVKSIKKFSTTSLHCKPKTEAPLTSNSFPYLQRDSQYSKLEARDIEYFCSLLNDNQLIYNKPDELLPYNTDWVKDYRGQSKLVLKPNSTLQVSKILSYCNNRKLAVVPQGGNTGLVGGGVPVFDEIIISLSNLNKVRNFQATSGVVVAEAGCILEALNQHLEPLGVMMPLDLASKGSCHIGGNLATNAGGLRLLRYGSLHGSVLGIEAVLPDGTVLDNLNTLRKDNTGYDIKQLLIGSEGTLGIITAAAILTPPIPKAVNLALIGVNSYKKVQEVLKKSRHRLNEVLSAFEFVDNEMMHLGIKVGEYPDPLKSKFPFYVLIETHGSDEEHDRQKLESLLEELMEEELIADGTLAMDKTQIGKLWKYREVLADALNFHGTSYKYDLSLPVPELYGVVNTTRDHLKKANLYDPKNGPVYSVNGFGHLGDGNLHLTIMTEVVSDEVTNALEPFIYELTASLRGSISAEHGLGLQKVNYLKYSKSEPMIKVMESLKMQLDPRGIMNPYKYLSFSSYKDEKI